MRIVGGRHRGLTLAEVGAGDAAAHLRPTPDRVREAVFNMLDGGRFGRVLPGARVLDLFAGTGALGIEALSRGAAHATFVDDGRVAQGLIRANLAAARRAADARVLGVRADRLPQAAACGLVFLDPPYGADLGAPALAAARAAGWTGPGTVVVWEEATAQLPPAGFARRDARRFGSSWVTFLEAI